jgi:hypothetical protein
MPTVEFLRVYFVSSLGWDTGLVSFLWDAMSSMQRSCAVAESYRRFLTPWLPDRLEGMGCADGLLKSIRTGPSVIGFDTPVVEIVYYEVTQSRDDPKPQLRRTCFGKQQVVSGRAELEKYLSFDVERMELHCAMPATLRPFFAFPPNPEHPLGRSQAWAREPLGVNLICAGTCLSKISIFSHHKACTFVMGVDVELDGGLDMLWTFVWRGEAAFAEVPGVLKACIAPEISRSAGWAVSLVEKTIQMVQGGIN